MAGGGAGGINVAETLGDKHSITREGVIVLIIVVQRIFRRKI
jgi:hypothetical protein